MLKVSFKGDYKKVRYYTNRTFVTLTGKVELPNLWMKIPKETNWWLYYGQRSVGLDFYGKYVILTVTGRAVCAEEDTFDPVIGERIAEARAKVKLYKFMETLCEKLMKYYYNLVWGNREFSSSESHTEAPKDCLFIARHKYMNLWVKESHHLGKLLEEA